MRLASWRCLLDTARNQIINGAKSLVHHNNTPDHIPVIAQGLSAPICSHVRLIPRPWYPVVFCSPRGKTGTGDGRRAVSPNEVHTEVQFANVWRRDQKTSACAERPSTNGFRDFKCVCMWGRGRVLREIQSGTCISHMHSILNCWFELLSNRVHVYRPACV
jgi:hypothetical protein